MQSPWRGVFLLLLLGLVGGVGYMWWQSTQPPSGGKKGAADTKKADTDAAATDPPAADSGATPPAAPAGAAGVPPADASGSAAQKGVAPTCPPGFTGQADNTCLETCSGSTPFAASEALCAAACPSGSTGNFVQGSTFMCGSKRTPQETQAPGCHSSNYSHHNGQGQCSRKAGVDYPMIPKGCPGEGGWTKNNGVCYKACAVGTELVQGQCQTKCPAGAVAKDVDGRPVCAMQSAKRGVLPMQCEPGFYLQGGSCFKG